MFINKQIKENKKKIINGQFSDLTFLFLLKRILKNKIIYIITNVKNIFSKSTLKKENSNRKNIKNKELMLIDVKKLIFFIKFTLLKKYLFIGNKVKKINRITWNTICETSIIFFKKVTIIHIMN